MAICLVCIYKSAAWSVAASEPQSEENYQSKTPPA